MNSIRTRMKLVLAGTLVALALGACATAPMSVEGKADIEKDAAAVLKTAKAADPTLGPVFNAAPGYAVFPTVGKAAAGIGGAYGRGVLYERGRAVGYCDLTQATVGLQFGGQTYSEIIAFETKEAVETFKQGNFSFAAQATAVALKSGAGANAKFRDGVAVFTMDETGLMYEAAVGGQKFSYQAK
ncbi:MAG: YSC84-related protein [Gammaproteobacteria bacterium]